MKWSKKKPESPGFYWVRAKSHEARVLEFINEPPMFEDSLPIQPTTGPLSTEGWEKFAGPLEKPK